MNACYLFPGYGNGEYYLGNNNDLETSTIYCTTDTGRTWIECGPSPEDIYWADYYEMVAGWTEGELFLLWGYSDTWVDSTNFSLYYSDDYAQTWELKNSMADPYPDAVDDNNSTSLPEFSIQIFPNPTNSMITIQIPDYSLGNLLLFDNLGRIILSQSIHKSSIKYSIDLQELPSGSYWLQYMSREKPVATKRIILLK
ncbi:MAG: T9SS type A sorting domain-containing protein [Candidatus Electryonea clarkiae]|nr:T9SS type A sorting domain-containing protein [Candidatus Electryonea clarkiae]MDP8287996.1 T9SS type A sorting domain-containing protein [Candidatus Electryonea clarkiae]